MTVKELFSDESKWTKNEYARDAQGYMTESRKPDAVCWCLLGGLSLTYAHLSEAYQNRIGNSFSEYFQARFNNPSISQVNDSLLTFETLHEAIDAVEPAFLANLAEQESNSPKVEEV